jgi:hypothetical protein
MRRAVLPLALAVFLLTSAPAAGHSVMKVEGSTIYYNATDDVALNRLSVTHQGNQIRFHDPGAQDGITAPTECTPGGDLDPSGNPREVFCPAGGITLVRIDVGEAQDQVTVDLTIAALVVGANGADRITTGFAGDTVNGGEGNDEIRTGDGGDTVVGGRGDDAIVTGAGNDTAQGGLGFDAIDTGAGDDEVRARDSEPDQVACGEGNDRAQVEDADRLTDCETVDRIATPAGAPGPGGAPAPGAPAGAPAAPDRTAPRLRAGALTRQRLGRRGTVLVVAVVSEAAELYATGYLEVGGLRYALGRARSTVTVGGGGTELRVALDRRGLRAARRALRRKRRATVSISVLATDRAGNSTPARLPRIRLLR